MHVSFRRSLSLLMIPLAAASLLLSTWTTTAAPAPAPSPLHLPPILPSPSGYVTEDAFPGMRFKNPLCLASPPGETDRLFVVEKDGTIQLLNHLNTKPQKILFMNLPAILAQHNTGTLLIDSEWGLLGLAFHPDFAHNGYFFITYDFSTTDDDGAKRSYNRLSRFTVSKTDPNAVDPDSELPLITQVDLANNHDGGDLHFGPDGYLYYSMGDEGGGNDNFDNARFIDKDFFAAIYRLDVDNKSTSLPPNPHTQNSGKFPSAVNPGAYKIPPDNPFIHATTHHGQPLNPNKIRTELYCCGLRNPWRFSFDYTTGKMYIGDVGQNQWEEIDIGQPGGDFGWSYREGTHPGPRQRDEPANNKLIPPIYDYGHGNATPYTGNCIIGGEIYRGNRLTELYGQYIFADFTNRHIWALRQKPNAQPTDKWSCLLLANGPDVAAFGTDPRNHDLLMCHFGGGRIERLARKTLSGDPPPPLLSQTGAFKDLATLTPADGLVPFTPAVPFWSDHALKTRWFTLATPNDKITFAPTTSYTFPTGTTFVKHFDLETTPGDPTTKRRLETRFLVKTPTGVYGITYKWRPDNSDADLVPETGLDEPITIHEGATTHTQIWHYPAQSECLSCHTDVAGNILGFNTWQLNHDLPDHTNQLQSLSDYFTAPLPDPHTLPSFARADDTTQSLDWRVRSYLAVNCIACHQPNAVQSNWDARPTTPNTALLAVKLQDVKNDPAFRLISPHDPIHSMLLQRLKANHVPRMPPLATNELDQKSIDLVTAWINSPDAGTK